MIERNNFCGDEARLFLWREGDVCEERGIPRVSGRWAEYAHCNGIPKEVKNDKLQWNGWLSGIRCAFVWFHVDFFLVTAFLNETEHPRSSERSSTSGFANPVTAEISDAIYSARFSCVSHEVCRFSLACALDSKGPRDWLAIGVIKAGENPSLILPWNLHGACSIAILPMNNDEYMFGRLHASRGFN